MTFSINHEAFDQCALGRYIASSVIRRIEGTKSRTSELRLPYTNKAERVIKTVSKFYPSSSNETEMPLFVDYFCRCVTEEANQLKLAWKSDEKRRLIQDPIEHVKSYAAELYKSVDTPIKLIGHEVDANGQFAQAFKDIKHQYQQALSAITASKDHDPRSAAYRASVEDAFDGLAQELIALCNDIRALIGLYEPPI